MQQIVDQINQDFKHHHQRFGGAEQEVDLPPTNEYIIVQDESKQEVTAKKVVIFQSQLDYGDPLLDNGIDFIYNWAAESNRARWCMANSVVPIRLIYRQNYAKAAWDIAVLAYFKPKTLTAYLLKWNL